MPGLLPKAVGTDEQECDIASKAVRGSAVSRQIILYLESVQVSHSRATHLFYLAPFYTTIFPELRFALAVPPSLPSFPPLSLKTWGSLPSELGQLTT